MHWSTQEAGRWSGITLNSTTNLCLLAILRQCLLLSFSCFLFSSCHSSPTDFLPDPLKIEIRFCVCFLKHKNVLLYSQQAEPCHRTAGANQKQVKRTRNKHKILNKKHFCYSKWKLTHTAVFHILLTTQIHACALSSQNICINKISDFCTIKLCLFPLHVTTFLFVCFSKPINIGIAVVTACNMMKISSSFWTL